MSEPTRLLIADDHPFIRAGLRALLSLHSEFIVVGEAGNGLEAVTLWDDASPDVGLFDLHMPGLDGIDALSRIRQAQPEAAVVILTAMARQADLDRIIGARANAFLPKDASMDEMVECLRGVRQGMETWHPSVQARLSSRALEERLTAREDEILQCMARGWSNGRVGDELHIAEGTVKTHVKRVLGKLYARNRTEAVAIARRRGLLHGSYG